MSSPFPRQAVAIITAELINEGEARSAAPKHGGATKADDTGGGSAVGYARQHGPFLRDKLASAHFLQL